MKSVVKPVVGMAVVSGDLDQPFIVHNWKETIAQSLPDNVEAWLIIPDKEWFWGEVAKGHLYAWDGMHRCILGVILRDDQYHVLYDLEKMFDEISLSTITYDEQERATVNDMAQGQLEKLVSIKFPKGISGIPAYLVCRE